MRRRPLPGRLRYLVFVGTASIWALLDQATKVLAVELLADGPIPIAFDGAIRMELVRNPNAAFNIPGFPGMFVLLPVLVVVLVLRALHQTDRLSLAFSYALVTGGAIGNGTDRILRIPGFPDGAVVDFIRVGWWPNFNLADSGLVVGAALVAVLLLLVDREERTLQQARTQHRSVRPGTTGPRG